MAVTLNTDGFAVNFAASIDKRLIVDRVDGTTSSLVSLEPNYNYRNMYVWVREEKSFYYLIDSPEEGGATFSDWTKLLSGGGSGSAIDITEVAFGTGTGITSSNNFTWNNTCNNLIASKGSKFVSEGFSVTSPNSAIIGGTGNSIFQSALGSPIGSNLILGSENSVVATFSNIVTSDHSLSIISGRENIIGYSSFRSTLIAGCKNIGDNVSNSAIIGGIGNCINESEAVSIIGSSGSFIDLSNRSVILGGIGLTLSNESNVVYVPELKIATASNSSTTDKVLVWDTTDNYVKWRSDSSLGLAKNAKKVAWESASGMPGQLASWGLTAGQDPNTVFFYNSSGFNSPQGDIVVSLNPATATPGLNRDFKLILANAARVENGNTWSVAYNGTRLVEYGEGRVEPHVLDFIWATSSVAPNGEYLLTKYVVDIPVEDFTTTGNAFGRDFTIKRSDLAFFTGGVTVFNNVGVGSSGVFPKGSILFVDESFVTCEGITGSVTGVNVSFGLSTVTAAGTMGSAISNFEPQLSEFGISNSYEMLFPPKALGDFFTGSIFYSKSPIGIVRLTQPAMLVIRPVGGNIAIGTRLKYRIPYIVDEASVNSISGTNFIAAPAGTVTGATGCAKSGYVSGTSFVGTGTSSVSVVFSTPYSSASYSVVVTSQAFTTTDYVYSVTDKTASGFIIRTPSTGPIGATAMWITNCYDGSGLSSGGGGAQGPTGPGGGSVIDLKEIAFGTGTGITSSNDFRLETGNNLILADNSSSINTSNFSSIIGGNISTITASQYSTLISSYFSSIKSSNCSLIIGSYQSTMCNSNGSVIIGNYNGSIKNSSFSTMIGGGAHCIDNTGIPGTFNYGGIVFGFLNKLCNSVSSSSIFSGSSNIISGTFSARDNIILGGNDNKIYGLSKYSSIVGGVTNSMTASYHSSIIGGYFNKICGGIGGGTSPVKYSSIIGGYKNKISSQFKSGTSENSVIIGGCNNSISNACNSAIIGGKDLSINGGSAVLGAFPDVVYVPSLKGHGSLQLQVTTSSTDIFLDDTHFTLITYPPVGGMTVSLPRADNAPNRLYIIKKNGSSTQSIVYIKPSLTNPDSIDGYTGSITLENPWDYNILQSDGVNMWIKLGGAVGINL